MPSTLSMSISTLFLSLFISFSISLTHHLSLFLSNTKLSANTISSALSSHGYGSNGYANGNSSTPTPAPVSHAHHLHTALTLSACAKTILSDTHKHTSKHTRTHKCNELHLKSLRLPCPLCLCFVCFFHFFWVIPPSFPFLFLFLQSILSYC